MSYDTQVTEMYEFLNQKFRGKRTNKRKEQMFRMRHGFTTKSKLFIVRQTIRSTGTSQIPALSRLPSAPKILPEVFLHASEILISQRPLLNFNHKYTILHQHHKIHTHKHCPHCRRQHHQRKRFCRRHRC